MQQFLKANLKPGCDVKFEFLYIELLFEFSIYNSDITLSKDTKKCVGWATKTNK